MYGHAWHRMPLLRPGVIKKINKKTKVNYNRLKAHLQLNNISLTPVNFTSLSPTDVIWDIVHGESNKPPYRLKS